MSEEQSGGQPHGYWRATRRPLVCLLFLAPLLAAYEAAVLGLGGQHAPAMRNGADYWMREGLQSAGLDAPWLLPAMIVVGLFVWHLGRQESWRVPLATFGGMLGESLLFACALIVFGRVEEFVLRNWHAGVPAAMAMERTAALTTVYVGAGIYEEVLFRLCLLPLCAAIFRLGGLGNGWAAALGIIATSLAFSLAHYVGPAGEPFRLFTFWFRTVAGLFFAALFVLRGFGITVGAHAAYDLIVGLVLSSPQ